MAGYTNTMEKVLAVKPSVSLNRQGEINIKRKSDCMQAIKAVFDGVQFKPKQPIPVKGQYEVVITFIEPLSINPITSTQDQISDDLNFWKEFDSLVADASDEVLSMDDFPRTKFNRELITFDDEV